MRAVSAATPRMKSRARAKGDATAAPSSGLPEPFSDGGDSATAYVGEDVHFARLADWGEQPEGGNLVVDADLYIWIQRGAVVVQEARLDTGMRQVKLIQHRAERCAGHRHGPHAAGQVAQLGRDKDGGHRRASRSAR